MPLRRTGYTLLEILVTISISSIVLIALVRFMGASIPQYRSLLSQNYADETARIQLKRIAHEIREARPSDTGAYPLVEASPQKIVFYANVDTDAATERVRYELIGNTLVRGITKPSGAPITYTVANESVSTIAYSIQNGSSPVFSYYNSNYPADTSAASDISHITYVSFLLNIDSDPANIPPATVLQSQVQLRNLKTNL